METIGDLMAGPLGIFISIFILIWGILMFFAPFFWYGTNKRTRELSEKMDSLIEIQEKAPGRIAVAIKHGTGDK